MKISFSETNRRSVSILIVIGVLLTFALTTMGCAAQKKMVGQTDLVQTKAEQVRQKQKDVVQMGGEACGLKELAIAESNRSFAMYEMERGDYPRYLSHLETADENVKLAWEKAVACEPPDRDKDGILDDVDQCPDDPEDKDEFQDEDGCPDPDNDQDGLLDVEDKCPDDPEDIDEFQDEDGCPDPDNDEDTILDVDDQCPNDPEDLDKWMDEDGCPDPDNDQDGLLDEDDKCPDKAENFNGIDDEDGCPEESDYSFIEITDKAIEIKQKIFFASGRARILSKSYPTLNEVALALNEHPDLKVEIGGHTDSNGSDAYNKSLSQKRANAVKDYLVKKGGVKADRVTAVGYGESKPIDTNRTGAGRARNRRVEFNISK